MKTTIVMLVRVSIRALSGPLSCRFNAAILGGEACDGDARDRGAHALREGF